MRWKPAVALLAVALLAVSSARAAEIGALRDKVGGAREEVASLGAEIRATQEQLASAESEAAAAAARERRLTELLAHGRERAASSVSESSIRCRYSVRVASSSKLPAPRMTPGAGRSPCRDLGGRLAAHRRRPPR